MRFPWQKDRAPGGNEVKMRAAVVPKSYMFQMGTMVTENNFTVNSYSTHFVTLQLLKPGETAESVAKMAPGTVNFGGSVFTKEEERERNLQRIQFDAPNWVGVIVCSDGAVYYDHVEVPVWADPTGKILGVDVDQMLQEMEPKRKRASEIWGETDGPFSLYFQIKNLPGALVDTGKMLGSLPGTWLGAVKEMVADMKGEGKAPEPLPAHMLPDLSKYPPVEGMDWDTWVMFSAKPQKIQELGIPQETWLLACRGWNERVQKDWKLGALYGNEVERVRKSGG
jgi:hypothetical protein